MKVIVVEDDEALLEVISECITLHFPETEVVLFKNADDAWQHIANAGGEIKLIISDINMPGKMNGLDLLREVKKIRSEIFFVSSSGLKRNLVAAKALGANEILQKPFSFLNIQEIIKKSGGGTAFETTPGPC
ncbi:MAG: response regulator [Patescibacteria group bacterium]